MKDIIYREDAIRAVEEALQNIFVEPKGLGEKIINPLPTAERTGKWIVKKDCEGKTRRCICDQCGHDTGLYTWENPNYCEDCGARMK